MSGLAATSESVLVHAALELTSTAATSGWLGPDPYDGLGWGWPRPLVAGRRRRQAVIQLHARAPVDVRRLYRREHELIPKTLALFAASGLRAHALHGNSSAIGQAVEALEMLRDDRRAGNAAWGYPWDVQTRWSFYPAHSPSIINCAFAVGALLEGERYLGRPDLGERARAAARWVLDELWVEPDGFFAYHPYSQANIHNANVLGAWLAWAALGEQANVRERVIRALDRTLGGQNDDGSWPYGEGSDDLRWADSFHTGYVLTCLERMRELDVAIGSAVSRGAAFYERFFGPRGEARLFVDRPYPEDGHSAGTGLTALAVMLRRDLVARDLLERVATRALESGIRHNHGVFRRYRFGLRSSVAYIRWCDGHLALGLVDAATALAGRKDPAPRPATGTTAR
jgi:hypothetical protein